MAFQLFAGGYAGLITAFSFALTSPTSGSLTLQASNSAGTNPSWLALSPSNSSILYANQETSYGQVLSFVINSATGQLTQKSSAPTGGSDPANFAVLLQSDEIVAANVGGPLNSMANRALRPDSEAL